MRPLFFDKKDLDHAIDSATSRKLERDRQALRDEMEILKGEAHEARLLVPPQSQEAFLHSFCQAKQTEGEEAEKWMSIAAKAETKARKLGKQIKELPDSLFSGCCLNSPGLMFSVGLVQVEVRSLEDVLSEMECDRSGQYGNTMLIPSGLSEGHMLETPFTRVGDKKIINLQNRD